MTLKTFYTAARHSFPGRLAYTLYQAVRRLIAHEGLELAGHLAFTSVLAIFPFLIFLAALFGLMGDEHTAEKLVGYLFEFAPEDVAETLAGPLYQVMRSHRGDLLTLGILGTLWAASSGLEALRTVLNRAYEAEETRSIWWRRLQSVVMVVGLAGVLVVSSSAIVLGPLAWSLVERIIPVSRGFSVTVDLARYAGAGLLFGVFLLAIHQFLPDRRQPWHRLLPGVALTLVFWLVASTALSLYLVAMGDYGATYGALGGVVITLMFFYVMAIVLILGAELNGVCFPPRREDQNTTR